MMVYILVSEEKGGVYASMNNQTGQKVVQMFKAEDDACLLYTSPSPRDS